MLIPLLMLLFAGLIVPICCVGILAREDVHPSLQALALLILAPFIVFLIRVLRIHL